jgi:hypothetical protein
MIAYSGRLQGFHLISLRPEALWRARGPPATRLTVNKPAISISTNAIITDHFDTRAKSIGKITGIEASGCAIQSKNKSQMRKMLSMHVKNLGLVCLLVVILAMMGTARGAFLSTDASKLAFPPGVVFAETDPNIDGNDELQWFKDQMEISEKYIQEQNGIWGMSWGHFFTMVFLVLFAIGTLVAFIQRQRRTREILEIIRREMKNGDSG